MGLYTQRIQAPTKERTAEWIPEDGELFRDSGGSLYMGDNVTASNALTAIGGGGGGGETPVGIPYTFEETYDASGIAQGEVRVNNATAGSITTMYVYQTDVNAQDFGNTLATLSAGGLVYLNTTADDTAVAVFKITAAVDSGTYYTLTGSFLSGGMPGDGSAIRVTVAPTEVTRVKRYVALLTQTGMAAPVATELERSLQITWSYVDSGQYLAALATANDTNTTVTITNGTSTVAFFSYVVTDDYGITIYNIDSGFNPGNDLMTNATIIITQYP